MQQPWFDTLEGKLIIGEAAYEQAILQSFPDVIRPLGELLLSKDFEFTGTEFRQKHTHNDMTREEKVELGVWVLGILEETVGRPVMLRYIHLKRLHNLGLAPSPPGVWGEFDNHIDNYRQAIKSPVDDNGPRGRFARMTREELIDTGSGIELALGRRTKQSDYTGEDRPSRWFIQDRVGGFGKLNEELGHPDIREFDKARFVAWGVEAVLANGAKRFGPNLIRALSEQGKGPSLGTIQNRFVRWSIFKKEVLKEYRALRAEQSNQYGHLFESGELPKGLRNNNVSDLHATIVRYRIVDKFALDMAQRDKIELACSPPINFIAKLLHNNSALTAGDIEMLAETRGAADAVLPRLYVTNMQLEGKKRSQRKSLRRHREVRQLQQLQNKEYLTDKSA